MPSKATTPVDDDAVRTRAYLLWEADGRPDGGSDHYWGLAHAELTTPAKPKRATASAAASVPEKKSKPKPATAKPKAAGKPVKAAPKAKKPKA